MKTISTTETALGKCPQVFEDLRTEELKKIYKDSRSLYLLGGFWILGSAIVLILSLNSSSEQPGLFLLSAAHLVAGGCMFRRASAADRIIGIVACVLFISTGLYNFMSAVVGQGSGGSIVPLIIAGLGLALLLRSKRLFGPERMRHADLKRESMRIRC